VPTLAVAALAVAAGASLAAAPAPDARATAIVARVSQPGLPDIVATALAAPPDATDSASFAYPSESPAIRVGAATASASAQPGLSSSAQASIDLRGITLFGGEVRAQSMLLRATVAAGAAGSSADTVGTTLTGLVVLGQAVSPSPGTRLPLADWGALEVLLTSSATGRGKARSGSASATGLRITLTAEHAGLPAGTTITLGLAEAFVKIPPAATAPVPVAPAKPAPAAPSPAPTSEPAPKPSRPTGPREPGKSIPGKPPELVREPPAVTVRLSTGGYVFPVFGPASFGDSFGASRPDVEGGWHHGEDIVGPLGTPLLAVADGTVFSVGWNELGGWRLWLRDQAGNEFYYAHLSAYSPLAVDGRRVHAGDVLGFMGNTGDADGGVAHLHFEIHPVELLSLGYGGVVAPYPFLVAWKRADDVSFASGRRYLPGQRAAGIAPPVGAVLLEADDISLRSGLVPGALGRAVVAEQPAQAAR
jgi:murein DD-endopeptidase MepM/ murein hydrolase activator NlpD